MRKKLLLAIAGIVVFGLLSTSCSDDDTTTATAVEVSGKVMYNTDMAAGGAVVYLSTSANAAEVIGTTIADSAGTYSFKNVAEGTYYLTSLYNTENTNLKAGEIAMLFQTATDVEISVGSAAVTQDISLVSNTASGTAVVDVTDGWTFDQTHSSVGFNFPYDEQNAPFYGQFGVYEVVAFKFDEANPANTSIVINLDMTSVESGAPGGRDGLNGCIPHTIGVTFKEDADLTPADTTADGDYTESAIVGTTNIATFTSTAVVAYGNGYKATGNMAFNGKSASVDFYFQYIEGFEATKNDITTKYSSFQAYCVIDALGDFEVVSGHVGEAMVTITASLQMKKTL